MSVAVQMAQETVAQRLWSRDRLLVAARGVDPVLRTEVVQMGQGTLMRTLEHMLLAETVWVSALEGDGAAVLKPDTYTDMEALDSAWPGVDARWAAFMAGLTEAGLGETVSRTSVMMNRTYELTVRDVLLHVSTHHMYTLAQAANMVRRFGGDAPSTGYAAWAVEATR